MVEFLFLKRNGKVASMRIRILALALLCVLAGASNASAEAFHRVHLVAKPELQVYETKHRVPPVGLMFYVSVRGHQVDTRGSLISNCRYSLLVHDLALELRNCGRSRITVRYMGTGPFTFGWKLHKH